MEYSIFDYPFESICNHDSKVTIIPEFPKTGGNQKNGILNIHEREKKESLKKRDPKKSVVQNVTGKTQVPVVLTFDSEKKEKTFQKPKNDFSNLEFYSQDHQSPKYRFIGMDDITIEQASNVEEFLKDLDQRINSSLTLGETGGKVDCGYPNLFMAKELIQTYFGYSKIPQLYEDHLRGLLRLHIDTASMISCLANIKDPTSPEPYQTKVSRFCDVLAGLLVNPKHFKVPDLITLRPGKPMTLLLTFFIKSVLQQITVFDNLYAGNRTSVKESQSLIDTYNQRYVEQLISTIFNLIACQRFKQSPTDLITPTLAQLEKSVAQHQEARESTDVKQQSFNFFEPPQEKYSERESKPSFIKCTPIAWSGILKTSHLPIEETLILLVFLKVILKPTKTQKKLCKPQKEINSVWLLC